jgi:anti-sigma-K factor RskA
MSSVDNSEPELGGDEAIAAEYVLGVLPADERIAATRRIDLDAAFARLVDKWEVYFAPMAAAYQPVEAPAAVKAAVDRRLIGGGVAGPRATEAGFWSSLALWRAMALAALAVLAVTIAVPYISPPVEAPQRRLVASLAADGSDVRYLVVYDAARNDVALSHVSGERGTGRDFELWMIEGQNAPVSLGVIPAGATAHLTVAPETKAKLDAGAVLAVSLEPTGGSPTGQPTGPVVAAGDLKSI